MNTFTDILEFIAAKFNQSLTLIQICIDQK